MLQVRIYNMINFRNREMNFFLLPSLSIEYFQEHTGIRIAWLVFMIAILVIHDDTNENEGGETNE